MSVLIAFVSSSYFQVATVNIQSLLGSSRFTANLSALFCVYVVHGLTQMFFGLAFSCEAFLPKSDILVATHVTVKNLSARAGVLMEVFHYGFLLPHCER
jgi:hypothetical protein